MPKPSTLATVDSSNALTTNLKAAFLLNEGAGTTVKDYVTGTLNLDITGGTWGTEGLILNSAGARAFAVTPANLKLTLPITIYLRMVPINGDVDDNCPYFGIVHNSAGGPPYASIGIYCDDSAASKYQANVNNGGGFDPMLGSATVNTDVGSAVDIAVVFTTTSLRMYRNSVSIAAEVEAKSNPTYDSTSRVGFGDLFGAGTSNPETEMVFGYIFNEELDASDLAIIRSNPYALFEEPAPSGVTLSTMPKIVEASPYRVDGRSSYLTYLKPKSANVALGPVSAMASGIRANEDDFSFLDLYL